MYLVTVREKTEESFERENDEIYLRHVLLSKILKYFMDAEFDTKISYVSSIEVDNPGQTELGGL